MARDPRHAADRRLRHGEQRPERYQTTIATVNQANGSGG